MMEKEYELNMQKVIEDGRLAKKYEDDLRFKVDLINVLKEIRDELRKDSYVNIKNPVIKIEGSVDKDFEKVISSIKANTLNGNIALY